MHIARRHAMLYSMNDTRTAKLRRKGAVDGLRYEPVLPTYALVVVGKPEADLPIIQL